MLAMIKASKTPPQRTRLAQHCGLKDIGFSREASASTPKKTLEIPQIFSNVSYRTLYVCKRMTKVESAARARLLVAIGRHRFGER